MGIEEKFNQAMSQIYGALRDDPINRSVKDMIGQLNLIELECLEENIGEHYSKVDYRLTK
jgi:hypothetical protein